jgi:hypothetical protein
MKRVRDDDNDSVKWPKIKGGLLDMLPNGTECMRWTLAKGCCSLWWCPWPEALEEPPLPATQGYYRKLQIYGKLLEMPRRTWCYGYAYSFSGQTHPVDPETPPQITALYAWANTACGVAPGDVGFNMDLCNHYPTGFHCINAHSDDERQFGSLHDVICFVTGPAERELVIRDKHDKSVVLRGPLPSGVYCMAGRDFQTHYTHEFPRLHNGLFDKVLKSAPKWFGPERWPPGDVSNAHRAEWLAEHGDEVLAHLDPKQATKWHEWMQWRTSHTLRNFVE